MTRLHTLAHLSDPHLTSLAGVSARELMNKRVLGYLSWLRRRRKVHRLDVLAAVTADIEAQAPDQILLSGDLTHVGLPHECRTAARWLEALARPDRLRMVPGNHDRYVDAPWDETLALWSDYLPPRERAAWPTLWQQGDLCVIGLDSAVASPPFMATGTLGEDQIEALAEHLRTARDRGQFRLVLLHHSPLPDGHSWRKRLTDARELCAVIAAQGAELVVHGHGHQEAERELAWRHGDRDGVCRVFAVPSASYAMDGRAGWNRIRVGPFNEGWDVEVEARRWVAGGMRTRWTRRFSTSRV